VYLVEEPLWVYATLYSRFGNVLSAQWGQFKYANGVFSPDFLERSLEQLMRPHGRPARDAHRHSRCRVARKFIGKKGGNAVDTEQGFVEAVEIEDEMGVSGLPSCKLSTFKYSAMKQHI
jgi:hypothetical protein